MKTRRSVARKKIGQRNLPARATPQAQDQFFPIVGIGASAGGLEAFRELLEHLPAKTGMAYVLVQHLDPKHESVLAEILSRSTAIPVKEVRDSMAVEPDHVYVIPPNTSMAILNGVLHLLSRTLTRGQHLPIDYFFHSLADERGDQAIGVILSGTASDGVRGCRAIKAAGGITFAQDAKTAKYSSMPHNAILSGCVDFVLPPKGIARELIRIGRHPYIARRLTPEAAPLLSESGQAVNKIFMLLRNASGVDFTFYKQSTLQRRIKRRMVLHKHSKPRDYIEHLKNSPEELEALYQDFLIHVTGFFRDAEAFQTLQEKAFPSLLENREDDASIRVWVPGCSTGEEVYSIAICLLEYLSKSRAAQAHRGNGGDATAFYPFVQIFATDISEQAMEKARLGIYPETIATEVSLERLQMFFERVEGGYRVSKLIREMCIFAKQNVFRDPPFSKLDLISCRNLLIYLGPVLQKRVIPIFHYALKPNGFLMLGASESLGGFGEHFAVVDKKHKIYVKKMTAVRLAPYFAGGDYPGPKPESVKTVKDIHTAFAADKEADRLLLSKYGPASVLINPDMEILQFRGHTGPYMEPAPGHATFNLSKMAREGLLGDLRAAIKKAEKEHTPVRVDGVRFQSNGKSREVDLEVVPIHGNARHEHYFLVIFHDRALGDKKEKHGRESVRKTKSGAESRDAPQLRQELAQTKQHLESLIEDHETTAEEFKAANEEVLSANEELQSTNEELETAKEELQSTNEELTTLNEELQNRNTELSVANSDLINLLNNVHIPIVMLGNDLRIRHFTPPAHKLLNLIPGDVGRRIGDIKPNINVPDLENCVGEAIETISMQEREVQEGEGTWYTMRIRPYKTVENKIDGAVMSFLDIDVLKRNLDQTRLYADSIVETMADSLLVLDKDLKVKTANRAFYQTFRVSPDETEGQFFYALGNGQWNIPKLQTLLEHILPENSRFDNFEVEHEFEHTGRKAMLLNACRINLKPNGEMILLAIHDITEHKRAEEALRVSEERLRVAVQSAGVGIWERDVRTDALFCSPGVEKILGLAPGTLGRTYQAFLARVHPQDRDRVRKAMLGTIEEGVGCNIEYRVLLPSGTTRWAASIGELRYDANGAAQKLLGIVMDITERKQTEEALRQLSAQLLQSQDDERRRIARELHDSTGQKVAAMNLDLVIVSKEVPGMPPKGREALSECLSLTEEVADELRSLSYLLHPPLLDEAGLISAIRWYTRGISQRSDIEVHLDVPAKFGRLPQEVETALFRIVQASLTNIHLHSGSKRAQIRLSRKGRQVALEVADEGHGMPKGTLERALGSSGTLGVGIAGMRERVRQLGGVLKITSSNKGTVVKATLPLGDES